MKKLYNQLFEPIKNVCRKAAGGKVILMAAILFSSHQGWGQAPVVSLSGPSCTTGTITLSSSISPARIVWQLNGVTQSTVYATWNATGTTVAGGNGSGTGNNQLVGPNSLYMDATGNIYIAEYLNHRVIKFPSGSTSATSGTVVAGTGTAGSGSAQLNGPAGVWVDGSGNIYVADEANNRIQKFPSGSTSGTNATTVAGLGGTANSTLSSPEGILLDGSGNLYVTDQFNNRVIKFPSGSTSGTTGTVVAGGNGSGSGANQLNSPTGIFLDGSGNLYVADFGNNRIQKFPSGSTSSTNATTVAGGNGLGSASNQLNNPTNVYMDGLGYLYVADAYNNRIQQFAPASTTGVTIAGSSTGASGSSSSLLNLPYTITMDGNGNIYTCDYNNGRVQEFTSTIVNTYNASSMGNWSAVVTTFPNNGATANYTINIPPSVTSNPISQTVCAGSNVTFTGSGSGSGLNYQWLVSTDGGVTYNNIPGQTTTSLTLTSVTTAMSGNMYALLIYGTCTPAVTTTAATLTVNALAAVTSNPGNQTICAAGNNSTGNTSFSVSGSGSGTLTYQWYVSTNGGVTYSAISNGGVYSGATTTTLTLTGASFAMNGYLYRATVTSSLCAPPATSTSATLTVNALPTISSQPAAVAICPAGNATFSVTVSGGSTYQWQVSTDNGVTFNNVTNTVPTTGATTTILSLSGVLYSMNGYLYRLLITGTNGCSLYSNNALLTVYAIPSISAAPTSQTVCVGSTATFNVTAAGQGITYQWNVSTNGGTTYSTISGATSSSYTTGAATAVMNGYLYTVTVSGTCLPPVTSAAATLNVQTPPGVTTGPSNATVCAGTNATFNVTASGSPIAYQWQLSTDGGVTYNNIPSANSASYTVVAPTAGMNGNRYRVTVSGIGACATPATSTAATLTISTAPAISSVAVASAICAGSNTSFTVAATGTTLTYQWQVSTNGGSSYTALTNTAPYSNVTTNTLNITSGTIVMNGYLYNVIVSGACPSPATAPADTLRVNPNPSIVFGANPIICAGTTTANLTFSSPSSVSTYSTAWSSVIPNVTNAAFPGASPLAISVPSSAAPGGYTAVITLNSGLCTSTYNIGVTINSLPAIATQPTPASTTICAGANASFSGSATGTGLSYSWNVSTNNGATYTTLTDGGVYSGSTTNTLSITAATSGMNGYLYQLVGSGTCTPPAVSIPDTLRVNTPIVIGTQPANTTACVGSNATISVGVTAGNNLSYQWQLSTDNGVTFNALSNTAPYSNVTTSALTITSVTTALNGYQYRVIVSGGCGPVTSSAGTLTIQTLPSITTQPPVSTTVCTPNNTSITAAGAGSNITYQWNVSTNNGASYAPVTNTGVYSGATTGTLTFTAPTASMNNYLYTLTATGSCAPAAVSAPDTLHVYTPVSITTQPANATVCAATNAIFTITNTGSVIGYQWYASTNGGSTYSALTNTAPYSGVTTNTLTATNVTVGMNGTLYYAVINGNCGSVTTNTDTLRINTGPAISQQPPASTTLCQGLNDTLVAAATGYNLTYQWQVSTDGGVTYNSVSGVNYIGGTTNTLVIANIPLTFNTYRYRLVVSGGCLPSPVTSNVSIVNVNQTTAVTTQPVGPITVCSGGNASFSVTAVGNNLSYQWNTNPGSGFVTVPGATSSTLSMTNLTTSQSGLYNVTVTGTCGIATSNNATLTVNQTPSAPTAQALAADSGCQNQEQVNIALSGGPANAWYIVSGPNGYTAGPTQASSVTLSYAIPASMAGVYTVYDSLNGCISSNTTNTIVVLQQPIISGAGPTTPAVCYGQPVQFYSNITSSYPVTYLWTGPLNGTPFVTSNTIAAPSKTAAGFVDAGVYTLQVTAQIGSHACQVDNSTANVTLTVNPLPNTPTVLPGNNQDSVCFASPISLQASSTTGGVSFKWQGPNGVGDVQTTPTYTKASAANANQGFYTVVAINSTTGCVSKADTLFLKVKPIPGNPTAGSNSPICAGSPLNLTSTSSNADSFSWSGPGVPSFTSNQQNPTILSAPVIDAGTYTVTAFQKGCASLLSASTNVVINPIPQDPIAYIQANPVCVGDSIKLSVQDSSFPGSAVFYKWTSVTTNNNTSTQQYYNIPNAQVGDGGVYKVFAYFAPGFPNGCRSANPSTINVTVNPRPATPVLSSNSPLCANGVIHFTATDATPFVNYQWSGPGFVGSNLTLSTLQNPNLAGVPVSYSGTYTAYAILNGCSSVTPGTTNVTVFPVPANPVASSNSPVCSGPSNNLLLFADSNTSVGPLTYVWSGANISSTSRNPVINNPTSANTGLDSVYTVDSFGCRSLLPGTVNIIVNPSPSAPAVNNITLCQFSPAPQLSAVGTNLRWYMSLADTIGSSVAPVPSDSLPGVFTYYVTQRTAVGCESQRAAIIVTVNQKPAVPFVTSNIVTYCQYDVPMVLSATGQNELWYTSATGGTGNPIAPTPSTVTPANYIYYVSQSINGCESNRQPITVIVKQKPQPPIVHDVTYCQNDVADSLHAVGQNVRWYNVGYGGVGTLINPVPLTGYPDTAIYYVTQTVNGCESDRVPQHVYVFYKPNVVIKTPNSYVCQHDTMTFFYFGNALPSASFDWGLPEGASIISSSSPDNIVVRFDSAGNQSLTLTVYNGSCKSTSNVLIVQVRPQPYAAINSLHSVCQDDIVQLGLTAQTPGTQYYNYNFDSGTVVSSASPGGPYNIKWTTPGIHVVQLVTTLNACNSLPATDTVNVHAIPDAHIVSVDAQDLNNICSGDSVEVMAGLINYGYQYQWSPAHFFSHGNNEPKLYANIELSGPIYLKVTSDFGCIGYDSANVTVHPCCNLYLPNAFTPNDDGKNDIFHILTIGHHTIRDFRIANRWGQTVFQTTDEKMGWDGKYNGVPQDMDTYFWYVDYICNPGNKEMKEQGEVYLVR